MKNLAAVLILVMVGVISSSAQAQSKRECSVYTIANPMQKTRGKNTKIKVNFQANKINILPNKISKSRGKAPTCMFSLYNYHNQTVHVYADSVYIGTLRPNSVGVVETLASFSKIYCVTEDQQFNWDEEGNCKCTHIYHLRIKENEGEIIN